MNLQKLKNVKDFEEKYNLFVNSDLKEHEKEFAIDLLNILQFPEHFLTKHCKIESASEGLVPFDLYEYQTDLLNTVEDNRFTFILKSRQLGFTTIMAAYSLWMSMRQGENVLLLSRREDDSMKILRKIKIMYENLDKRLQEAHPLKSSNATTIEFANKNRIMSLPATERSGAGDTASLIVLDEFSAFPAAKDQIAGVDVWTAILPTISTNPNAKVVVGSTPKGMGNHFSNLWHGENGFAKKMYHWTQNPVFNKGLRERENPEDGYGKWTSDWAEPLMRNMTPAGWAQEFNGDFVQSGRPVFNWASLVKTEIQEEDLNFGNHYVCGVDLASGSGNDWHVAQFICTETGRQVETYRSKEPLDIFGINVMEKCKKYNTAKLAFENNAGYGITFMKYVKNYPNLYYQEKVNKKTLQRTSKLGWNTNKQSKELMITDLNLALINKEIFLTDDTTISECKTYQYDDQDRMNAQAGFNDDAVTSLAIAWQVAKGIRPKEKVEPSFYRPAGMPVLPDAIASFCRKPERDWRIG